METLEALAAMLNAGVVPVVPQLGSVGASGDLAPLSHLAIVLLGGGEAFVDGQRMPGAQALQLAGLQPVSLSYKEGLALNNGTAQMLATGVLALAMLDDAGLDHALALSQHLRAAGFNVETQLEPRKLAKQLQYADRAGIRFVVIRGEDEASRRTVAVKDLRRGNQFEVAEAELAQTLQAQRDQSQALPERQR